MWSEDVVLESIGELMTILMGIVESLADEFFQRGVLFSLSSLFKSGVLRGFAFEELS